MRKLRDYQAEAVAAVEREHEQGRRRTAAVLATGMGKTDILAALAWREVDRGGRVLALCHRYELLEQINARLRMHRPDVAIGRIAGQGRKRHGFAVDTGMTSTLARGKILWDLAPYSLVLYDEFHHAAAKGNVKILRALGCMPDGQLAPETRLAGLTATLTRAERRGFGLADVCDSVAITRDIRWGIEHRDDGTGTSVPVAENEVGYLVRPYGVAVVAPHVRLAGMRTNASGDYADGALGEMVAQDMTEIVAALAKRDAADPRQTAAFWPTVETAQAATAAMLAAGLPAATVTGDTPLGDGPDDRGSAERGTGIYGALAKGELRCVNGVMVMTEGWDCPPVSRILMARPTKLPGLYQQIVGRGLRPCPAIGKRDCEILDVVGMIRGQTLATLADLVPGSTYDASALDLAPCETCGGFTRAQLRELRAQWAAELPYEPPEPNLCVCNGGTPRDPDGGRKRIQGPAEYEFVDVLGSEWLWLATPGGTPVLTAGVRFCAILANPDGRTFRAAHMALHGPLSASWRKQDAQVIVRDATIEGARLACEAWAEAATAASERATWNRAGGAWRKGTREASREQQEFALRLGVEFERGVSSRDLSDLITLAQVRMRGIR